MAMSQQQKIVYRLNWIFILLLEINIKLSNLKKELEASNQELEAMYEELEFTSGELERTVKRLTNLIDLIKDISNWSVSEKVFLKKPCQIHL